MLYEFSFIKDPGRTFKGKKMPGKMGNERITTQNVKVIKVIIID